MIVKEQFRRGPALGREPHYLPAAIYNRSRLLLSHSDTGCVFVPIRNLQYQAVIDHEEIIFVDGIGPRVVHVAWEGFRPQTRQGLDEPVPYDRVTYHPDAREIEPRLQGEFALALVLLEQRLKAAEQRAEGRVIAFCPR
jgi:hypothetical protein